MEGGRWYNCYSLVIYLVYHRFHSLAVECEGSLLVAAEVGCSKTDGLKKYFFAPFRWPALKRKSRRHALQTFVFSVFVAGPCFESTLFCSSCRATRMESGGHHRGSCSSWIGTKLHRSPPLGQADDWMPQCLTGGTLKASVGQGLFFCRESLFPRQTEGSPK